MIQQKNKDITDSIQYAERIQRAILPAEAEFAEHFSDSFVIFKPKDVVSGDFFFLEHESTTSEGVPLTFLAAADCTGHGVQGSLMSMLGNEILKEVIIQSGHHDPAQILGELHQRLRKTLKQTKTNIRDDITLLTFYPDKVLFTGARNGVVYVQDGELKYIGGEQREQSRAFTSRTLLLSIAIEALHLFSDGFPDQFGGPKNRKFSARQLRAYFQENYSKSCAVQQQELEARLTEWMEIGEEQQIDDILLIGVKPK